MKILLVEDNELNRDMLVRRLKRRGYEIVIASDGAEALRMAASENPAVILMDMSLPVMDGYEATERLKADPALRHLPVIGLSAHALAEERAKAIEAGCDDYDTKPVEIDRLIEKIEAAAGEKPS